MPECRSSIRHAGRRECWGTKRTTIQKKPNGGQWVGISLAMVPVTASFQRRKARF